MPQANIETSSSSSITQTAFSTGPGYRERLWETARKTSGRVYHSDPSWGTSSGSDKRQPQGSAVSPTTESIEPQATHTVTPDTALKQTVPAPEEKDSPAPDAPEPDAREQGIPGPEDPEPDALEPDASTLDSCPTTLPEGTCDEPLMEVLWLLDVWCRESESTPMRVSLANPFSFFLSATAWSRVTNIPISSDTYLRACRLLLRALVSPHCDHGHHVCTSFSFGKDSSGVGSVQQFVG